MTRISIAALISFIARGLSTTNYFCYEALSSAGVVLVLPGYVIRMLLSPLAPNLRSHNDQPLPSVCGSLELASKNLVAGSVRMVYAFVFLHPLFVLTKWLTPSLDQHYLHPLPRILNRSRVRPLLPLRSSRPSRPSNSSSSHHNFNGNFRCRQHYELFYWGFLFHESNCRWWS